MKKFILSLLIMSPLLILPALSFAVEDGTGKFYLPASDQSQTSETNTLSNSQWTLWLNEANNEINISAKEKTGTFLTFQIANGFDSSNITVDWSNISSIPSDFQDGSIAWTEVTNRPTIPTMPTAGDGLTGTTSFDVNTGTTSTTGLEIVSDQVRLMNDGCTAFEVLKRNSSNNGWECVPDLNTVGSDNQTLLLVGDTLSITGGNSVDLSEIGSGGDLTATACGGACPSAGTICFSGGVFYGCLGAGPFADNAVELNTLR